MLLLRNQHIRRQLSSLVKQSALLSQRQQQLPLSTSWQKLLFQHNLHRFSTLPPGKGGPHDDFGAGKDPSSGGRKDSGAGYTTDEDGSNFESDKRFSNFILFTGVLALAIIFMASNVMHLKKEREAKQKAKESASPSSKSGGAQTTYTGKADIGGPWMLYNTKGEPVTHKDFQGKYYLIYFGFTYCPDVCPVSLMKMCKSLNRVKESKEYKYFDLEAIFVSVDPDRDTNERIEEYVKIFDPSLIGLTHKNNTNPELKEILRRFKIHVSKIFLTEEEEKEDLQTLKENAPEVLERMQKLETQKKSEEKYTLDHSIIVYLIGPDNQFLTYLGSNLDENDMTDIILDEISADLKKKILNPNKPQTV